MATKTTQNWVGILDRSYEQIKRSILSRIPLNNPELTDHSETNPLIMLVGIFAGIAEVLHLYIDAMQREAYIGTARKFTSVLNLVSLLDYRVKTRIPSFTDLTITLLDNSGDPTTYLNGAILIPKNSIILSDPQGISFVTQETGQIKPGTNNVIVEARQYTEVDSQNLGVGSGVALQTLLLPEDYAHNSLRITIGTDIWTEFDSFAFMSKNTKGFIVNVLEDASAYVIFGDGINGAIPPNGQQIYGTYNVTQGALGNLPPNTITKLSTTINLPAGYTLGITNTDYSAGGSEIEGIEDIRKNGPLHLSTLHRAVSYPDYINLPELAPGVGQCLPRFCCADDIKLYITPKTRGIASKALITSTDNFFENKRLLGRKVTFLPAGISRIFIKGLIVANPGYSETDTLKEVYTALDNEFGFNKMRINSPVKPSDIIGVLEALSSVDTFTPEQIYLEPYVRPSNKNQPPLAIAFTQVHTDTYYEYKLIFNNDIPNNPKILIYKNNGYINAIPLGQWYADSNIIGFMVSNTGLYQNNQEWDFKIYPTYPEVFPVFQIEVDDNSVPIVDVDYTILDVSGLPKVFGDFKVEITSATSTNLCKPDC